MTIGGWRGYRIRFNFVEIKIFFKLFDIDDLPSNDSVVIFNFGN